MCDLVEDSRTFLFVCLSHFLLLFLTDGNSGGGGGGSCSQVSRPPLAEGEGAGLFKRHIKGRGEKSQNFSRTLLLFCLINSQPYIN